MLGDQQCGIEGQGEALGTTGPSEPGEKSQGGDRGFQHELMQTINPRYFDKSFDAVRHALEDIPADGEGPEGSAFHAYVNQHVEVYESALDRVTHELSANVMANYGTFVSGMGQVQELGNDLIITGMRCKGARRHLRNADAGLARTGVELIGKLRRRAAMRTLVARLEGITGAVRAAHRLQALLGAELSEEAALLGPPPLELLQEAAGLLATCRSAKDEAGEESLLLRLSVIADLDSVHTRLQGLMEDCLRQLCLEFDAGAYERILDCAVSLDLIDELASGSASAFAAAVAHTLTETARAHVLDQLAQSEAAEQAAALPSTTAAVGAPASELGSNAERMAGTPSQRKRIASATMKELVGMVHEDKVASCLLSLLSVLASVFVAHHAMVTYHQQLLGSYPSAFGEVGSKQPEVHETMAKGLFLSRGMVWVEMQRQLSVVIVCAPTATFSIDQMLSLLSHVESFMQLGQAFSGEAATVLRSSLRTKSANFYASFHRERLDELKMRLESELWVKLPVRSDALRASVHAPEGAGACAPRALRETVDNSGQLPVSQAAVASGSLFPASYVAVQPLLAKVCSGPQVQVHGEPVSRPGLWEEWLGMRQAHHLRQDDESRRWDVEDAGGTTDSNTAVTEEGRPLAVCGTALNFAKVIHRYLHVMAVLQPIAAEAFGGLCSLFELLFLVVFTAFWGGARVGSVRWDESMLGAALPPRLKGGLLRMHHVYVESKEGTGAPDDPAGRAASASTAVADTASAVHTTTMHILSALHSTASRFGPQESIVAAESMLFVAAVLRKVRTHIEARLRTSSTSGTATQLAYVASFYAQAVDLVSPLEEAIQRGLACKMLDLSASVTSISAQKWDLKEIGTAESTYVHQIVSVVEHALTHINLLQLQPGAVIRLHETIVSYVSRQLVEGYAAVRKCSQEGRAQMSIDVQTLQAALSERLGCTVQLEHADAYIKAFYTPPDQLLGWVQEHPEFCLRELISLVNCGPGAQLKKKARDDLIQSLEELRGGDVATTGVLGGAESGAGPGGQCDGNGFATKHVRNASGGTPRGFQMSTLGKWAQNEAARLKAGGSAMASAGRRVPSAGTPTGNGAQEAVQAQGSATAAEG